MQVDPAKLQQGVTDVLQEIDTAAFPPGSPGDHVIQLLKSIEASAAVASAQAAVVNAVLAHVPNLF
jgi:hypothetical protein